MFARIKDFFNRHRRKFIFSGVAIAAAVAIKKFVEWKLAEMEEQAITQQLARTRRQLHFDNSQAICDDTIRAMLPSLQEELFRHVDTDRLTTTLKSKQGNKLDIWGELKIASITKVVAAAYGVALLGVFLRTQSNILGGYLFLQTQSGQPGRAIAAEVQKAYLEECQFLLSQGLLSLIEHVRAQTHRVMDAVTLTESVDSEQLAGLLQRIQAAVEAPTVSSPFAQYLVKQSEVESETTDPALKHLLDETLDVIDTPLFGQAVASAVNVTLAAFVQRCRQTVMTTPAPQSSGAGPAFAASPAAASAPLAKIIPFACTEVELLLNPNGTTIKDVLASEAINALSSSIFRSFSQD